MAKPTFEIVQADGVRLVKFEIPGGVTTPKEFAEAVDEIAPQLPGDTPVVFDGRGPVWGFGMLLHATHPTPWTATADPRLGAVVVATHSTDRKVGDVIAHPAPA
jgi:CRISPR-associated protein Csx3